MFETCATGLANVFVEAFDKRAHIGLPSVLFQINLMGRDLPPLLLPVPSLNC